MPVVFLAFLVGVLSGLRAFMSLIAVSWAARLDRLHLGPTHLAFLGYKATPYIATALGVFEFVADQLPSTPSRKVPKQLLPRLLLAVLAGTAIGLSGGSLLACIVLSVIGALLGTYGGAWARTVLADFFKKDRPAAVIEDCVAIALAVFVVVNL
ncbi:DUF4126 domain-containing protein [Tunturiibacter empetritectus]|uniref:Membrane protein n=1 Tax=Tunturiibacter lichenicola TaxID=2051959 RepID=A0A852VBX4_9BACT|nr:DUF4126 domain-containing protein [Edaphobacter lichenicola]NYF87964.1 putative membrane protein [Edaphobacter lichenicola]